MGARLKAVPPPVVSLSPERAKLSEAISRRDDLRRRMTATRTAVDGALHESMSLRRELDLAQPRIEDAQKLAATNAVERAMQRSPIPGQSVAEARQAVATLEDQHAALQDAREYLAAQLSTIEKQLDSADSEVNTRLSDLLWNSPEVRQLLSDLQTATRTRLELINAVHQVGAVPNHLLSYISINPQTSDTLPAKWRDAIAKLKENAEAELPS